MWAERAWLGRGILGVTALGLTALVVAACGQSSDWPPSVQSGAAPGGGSAVNTTGGGGDAGGSSGEAGLGGDASSTLIYNESQPNLTALCNSLAAGVGGYGKSTPVTCSDGTTATLTAPTSLTACLATFNAYMPTCPATFTNATNCFSSIGACAATGPDCSALSSSACGLP